MKLILPLFLLTLLVSCNSKTNVIRVDDSRTGSSSGGSWSSGSDTDTDTDTDSGSTTTTPPTGCTADGVARSGSSSYSPYISIEGIIVSGKNSIGASIARPSWTTNGSDYSGRLYSDSILKIRMVVPNDRPTMGSSVSSSNGDRDIYGTVCNAENIYTKLQATIGVREVGGTEYIGGPMTIPVTSRNDCSSIKTFMVPYNNYQTRKPIVVDVLNVSDDTRCIWANNSSSSPYCPIYDLPVGNTSVQCVKFTLQIETDLTVTLPQK